MKKKKKNNNVEISTNNMSELTRLIIFIVIIIVLFAAFYVISLFIDSEKSETTDNTNDEVTVIQYDEILIGTLLNQNQDSYYVLITSDDNLNDVYSVYKTSYESKEDALKMYTVNIDSPFNKSYIAEESNFSIDKIGELKIKEDTLIKVENNELVEYFEGKDEIINELKNISE